MSLKILKNKQISSRLPVLYLFFIYFAFFIAKLLKTAVAPISTSPLLILSLTHFSQALVSTVIMKPEFSQAPTTLILLNPLVNSYLHIS